MMAGERKQLIECDWSGVRRADLLLPLPEPLLLGTPA
jgi:hypothetical protein